MSVPLDGITAHELACIHIFCVIHSTNLTQLILITNQPGRLFYPEANNWRVRHAFDVPTHKTHGILFCSRRVWGRLSEQCNSVSVRVDRLKSDLEVTLLDLSSQVNEHQRVVVAFCHACSAGSFNPDRQC